MGVDQEESQGTMTNIQNVAQQDEEGVDSLSEFLWEGRED